jgi:hypothetical protein
VCDSGRKRATPTQVDFFLGMTHDCPLVSRIGDGRMTAAEHSSPSPFTEQQLQKMQKDDIFCSESVLGVVLSVVVIGVVLMTVTVLLVW